MSKFLTGDELENKLTDIIWNAKKYIIIISPFIKLDEHIKEVFDKVRSTHDISVYIVFGKNEEYKYKSFNEEDLEYFKEFKDITILYNANLHAKHYCNENEGLITSLNLYGYSMVNNIEYGVYFTKSLLNPIDKLFEETEMFTDQLMFENSEVIYLKKPQYSKRMLGLKKVYQDSKILFDVSQEVLKGRKHETRKLGDFDLDIETTIEKKYCEKPERIKNEKVKSITVREQSNIGYCIRTGEEIPFNPDKPMSYNAYLTWVQFENHNYPEKFCHATGLRSNGKTSMANPILSKKNKFF